MKVMSTQVINGREVPCESLDMETIRDVGDGMHLTGEYNYSQDAITLCHGEPGKIFAHNRVAAVMLHEVIHAILLDGGIDGNILKGHQIEAVCDCLGHGMARYIADNEEQCGHIREGMNAKNPQFAEEAPALEAIPIGSDDRDD